MQSNKTKIFRFERDGKEVHVIGADIVRLMAEDGAILKGVTKA